MNDDKTASATGVRTRRSSDGNVVTRFFASIGLFLRQVLDELRKVVRPSREELGRYTWTVIVFVLIVMLFTFGLDWVFTKLVFWVFAE